MKRYAIFGGTFDPFTVAHKAIVNAALDLKDENGNKLIDEVFVAPTIVDYHREGKTSWLDDDKKIDVINAMLADLKYGVDWQLWDDDIKLKRLCKTDEAMHEFVDKHRFIHTLLAFKSAICQLNDVVYVIVGSDFFMNFKTWFMHDEILSHAKILVVPGRNIDDKMLDDVGIPYQKLCIGKNFEEISASDVRHHWNSLSKGVDAYISEVAMQSSANEALLLHTPIFDVVRGKKNETGLEPIKVNAPDWVTIIVEKSGKLLIEHQLRHGSNTYVNEFPCGMVEISEDPIDAAVRELDEETGYRVANKDSMLKLGSTNPNPAFMTNKMHYFYVNLDTTKEYIVAPQSLDKHEKLTFSWEDKHDFINRTIANARNESATTPAILLSAILLLKSYDICSNLH